MTVAAAYFDAVVVRGSVYIGASKINQPPAWAYKGAKEAAIRNSANSPRLCLLSSLSSPVVPFSALKQTKFIIQLASSQLLRSCGDGSENLLLHLVSCKLIHAFRD